MDDPRILTGKTGLSFVREHDMTPLDLIERLAGMEKTVFKKLYAGNTARKMYHLYEYVK